MSFEQQLEDLLVRAFKRAIVEGLQSLPFTLPADPGTVVPPQKRTRKPKEEAPQPQVVESGLVATEDPVVAPVQTPVVAQAAAEVAVAEVTPEPEVIPEIVRSHVSAALITVAQTPELGPGVAYKILTDLNVKDVNGLKTAQYAEVVAAAARLLGKSVADTLKLEPKKV